ncbi:TPA: hypothetical protein P2N00_003215 [Aeromonas salmonicida]|nr:hypothetical protein [Aeromonas salmonicida]EKP0240559.1 hypothetical protein [Aeromonas salmonicida]EKP0244741.1 hypothetical protein [Aeromonas salmonicida]EKP0253231.1 hypothetical protein [Aeromonas salmonicida]EKP0257438.1 hypothetical protein [Aeromonas salmonicida]EKP0265944.1 hypothetical protein [Aeromonas salmonicida]
MDGKFWRVDWKGAVLPNPDITTEPLFQIVLSPFLDNPFKMRGDKRASVRQTDVEQQIVVDIGIGQLPLIATGSVWMNGICQDILAGKYEAINNLLISPQTTQIITATHKENGKNIIPYKSYRIGKAGAGSKLVAIERNGDPFALLIPVMELVRFYYAISTNLSHALFFGSLQHNPDSVINLSRTHYRAEDDRFFLGLRQHITDEEGWIIARILHSKEAFLASCKIHDAVLRNAINHKFIHIESDFPFTGLTNLEARVKWIQQSEDSPWRCLVLSLERCSAPLPYSHLTVIRDNDGTGAKNDTDRPEDEKKLYSRKTGTSTQKSEDPHLQSGTDTNASLSNMLITVPSDRFGALTGRKPDKPTKEECEYRSAGTSLQGFLIDALGTGLGGFGLDEKYTQKANVSPTYTRKKGAKASFDILISAVEELNKYNGISASIRQVAPAFEYMPLTKSSKRWQWAYLDSSTKTKRDVIIADILFNGQFFNIIEFEMRENENFTVSLISSGEHKLNAEDFHKILFRCSLAGGIWKKIKLNDLGIDLISLKHTWSDHQSFSEAINRRIITIS